MSVLDAVKRGVAGFATVAGKGYEGLGQDQEVAVKNAMAKAQAERDATRDNVLNVVAQRPHKQYDPARGVVVDEDGGTFEALPNLPAIDRAPVRPPLTTIVGSDGKPIRGEDVPGARVYEPPRPLPLVTSVGSNGLPTRVEDKPGVVVPGPSGSVAKGLAAPMAAKVGQFGEMLKKAHDLFPATEQLEVTLGQSGAQDIATQGIGAFGMHVPGTKGLGASMLAKSPAYATYQAALTPFVLAAAHALSGARINNGQVEQIRNSIEIKPDEPKESRAQKQKNLIDLINSIGGSLPKDAIGEQEGQMDEAALALMTQRGYRRAGGGAATAAAPSAHGAAPIGSREAAVAHLKAQGKSDAQILQILGPP